MVGRLQMINYNLDSLRVTTADCPLQLPDIFQAHFLKKYAIYDISNSRLVIEYYNFLFNSVEIYKLFNSSDMLFLK